MCTFYLVVNSDYWGPGDVLPESEEIMQDDDPFVKIHDCIQTIENKIDTAFTEFRSKLQSFEPRFTALEQEGHDLAALEM